MLKKHSLFILLLRLYCLHYQGVSAAGSDEVSKVSVKEGGSVRLDSGVEPNQQDQIRWYFNNTRIAQISENFTKTCTDVQCSEGTERFRGRLKLDHQTGSLTITDTRTTDSGLYQLEISSNRAKTYSVNVHGFFSVTEGVSVFLMESDSVTLQTNTETNQQSKIKWYFKDNLIAQINGDQSKSCTDVQCNEGAERFRDRLKLDHQTGSLTIMNTRNTDSGEYELQIVSETNGEMHLQTFRFFIHDVSAAAEQDEMKKKEGEHVTLYTGVINHNDLLRWKFNDTLLAEITEDQSKICTDEERFRDRLKLDHQTGSLTIMNIRNTDSGEYHQQINSSRFSISRSFTISVTVPADQDSTAAVIGGVAGVGAVLLVAAAAGIYWCIKKHQRGQTDIRKQREHDEENGRTQHLLALQSNGAIELNSVHSSMC